jgi:peptidoglycan hydrolase-like protein with peptidoglycan-binding domain
MAFPKTTVRPRRATALAAACTALVAGTASATAHASTGHSYLDTLNHERATRGVAPLQTSADLTQVAQAWARELAATEVLRHNPGLESEVAHWRTLGENVGDGASLWSLANAFWNSPAHRENILDPRFSQVGIARVWRDGRYWMAVVFRQPTQAAMQTQTRRTVQAPASRSSTRAPYVAPTRLLSVGSAGSAVAVVQRRLGISADGLFGPLTRQAVVRFQRRHGLAADGIVGPITWRALTGERWA